MRNILVLLLLFTFIYSSAQAEDEKKADDIVYQNAYLEISPDIVSNVQGQAKYIRTSIQLMTNRADLLWEVEPHMPLIRHTLLMYLVDQKGENISTPAGKEKLRKQLLKTINEALNQHTADKDIMTDLFFTSYYVK